MAIDYPALKTELTTNPTGITVEGGATLQAAYAAGRDADCANALNVVRANISVNKGEITIQEFTECFDATEFGAITAAQREWVRLIGSGSRVRVDSGSASRTGLLAMFPQAQRPITRAALTAVATRTGSRGEQLFGVGTDISPNDIALARQA